MNARETIPAFAELARQFSTAGDAGAAAVWRHFETMCLTPRVSKHEGVLRDAFKAWADARGLATEVDTAGNLIIRKAASAGCERSPGVVMQGHIDMVCQANSGVAHDFYVDPIRPVLSDGWLIAEQTTLGADNGIGVALALAALEVDGVRHGPLEVLLTVDEEAGMGGARGLQAGTLRGTFLLNLDTEDWGEFYIGCAGGLDVNVTRTMERTKVGAGRTALRVAVSGLRGGHSGMDINSGRGNAIKLLVRTLCSAGADVQLATMTGGTARNAIPREASATVVVAAADAVAACARMQVAIDAMRSEFSDVESELTVVLDTVAMPADAFGVAATSAWLSALHAAPLGVRRMSTRVSGVPETSNNLGMVYVEGDTLHANLMVRSLVDSASLALGEEAASLFRLAGCEVSLDGHYPGWRPNPDSALLARCRGVYDRDFAPEFGPSSVHVIHAGLECGILGASHPQIDMVSFGPTIRGAHAPGERVEVAAVARSWKLLVAILDELAQ